ncbi:uncharacterized protein LOC100275622 [Zea mays]|uniref:Uncharacterized protein n=1 Tax=Zea mays TaxID=4577 RepID=B6SWR8_MAIZE|nr:uncharacterized protein LOC100275622 [Zea mays]ACG29301.1 hypothetical protein [Zea mays]ACR34885.1 unknown [Zea mays]ONL95954.1 hypothetical protein ZEAMMB73_Zm00001d028415 [Zea mays]ONL95955.1 hypothetical protein ZEAMMB73_Zm00001d028415 [Zea mays]ONL95958.1 hypothetical protein ZEAMMB73_Zm00001d028415 [Zea mays]|eukprot:NP_001143142.1 uncharacterized protein LOC100275622 [Zea mays]
MPKITSSPSPTISAMNPLLPSSFPKSPHPPDPNPSSPNPSPCSYLLHADADDEALIQIPGQNPSLVGASASFALLPSIDPAPHVSSQFYTFSAASYGLMLRCIRAGRSASSDEVRGATSLSVLASWRAVWKDRNEDTAYLTAWKRIQDKLAASADGLHLHFKSNAAQRVSHVGMWRDIVSEAHADPELLRHLAFRDTVDRIKQSWTVGAKFYGIPESFVRACVAACPVCKAAPAGQPYFTISSPGHGKRRRRFEYTETLDVPARDVARRLQQLAAKHKVVLCIRQKYIRYRPFMAEVKDYACHRAGEPTSSSGSAASSAGNLEGKKARVKREPYQSKRCGCGFRIRAIVPIANYNEKDKSFVYLEEGTAVFKLYAVHSGHEPGPLDGNARIVHRLVGHKGGLEFDPDIYGVSGEGDPTFSAKGYEYADIDDSHQAVLQQVRDLRSEVLLLEGKVAKMHPELLGSLSTELSEVLHRIRKFNLEGNVYQHETLMVGNEEVRGWGSADVSHQLDQHDRAFCKDDEMLDDDTDFGSSLGPIVSWDRMEAECEDRKMLMGDSPKCDKWMLKDDVGEFDAKSILNCGDDDGVGDSKVIKPLMHDDTMVTGPSLVGIHVEGFYAGTKWYDSQGLDSSVDGGDSSFRHGGIV